MSKIYLLEIDDENGHEFVLGVFSSEQKAKDFLAEIGTPVDDESKSCYDDCHVFYSTAKYEVMITELDMDKAHPDVSLLKEKKMI